MTPSAEPPSHQPADRADHPDADHRRPRDADDETVWAVGKLTEALESVERARGHLYSFHQLTGKADFELDDAVDALRRAGHHALAERVSTELVGRNVLPGRWTFQILEDYEEGYVTPFREVERDVREQLVAGRRHLYEAELKERRRTRTDPDDPSHRARP